MTETSWARLAMRPDIVHRSARVAVVVGTLLALINHGDAALRGELADGVVLKVGLTYLVPYMVSTWASVQTARAASS